MKTMNITLVRDAMWFTLADILREKLCFERSKTGACCHTHKRGKLKGMNPCSYTVSMIEAIENGFATATMQHVIDHVASKRCRNSSCNHRGCHKIDNALQSVQVETRRAA